MRLSSRSGNGDIEPNGDLPQSTLAAQLVQHFTVGRRQATPNDQETFQQLLHEVLGTKADHSAFAEDLESNINVNGKLIYVIATAGLDSVPLYNPFDNNISLYQRLKDSLAAIEITIRRCPEVLFANSPHQDADWNDHGLLFEWLLPKLFALIARSQDLQVQQGVADLVKSCMVGERRSMSTNSRCSAIEVYMKGCTRGKFPSNMAHFN